MILEQDTTTKVTGANPVLQLDSPSVRQYWFKASPGLAELFERIELTEDWTLDEAPEIASRLVVLGRSLSEAGEAGAIALSQADRRQLLVLLVYISSSKAMRLLSWLDQHQDGLGDGLLATLLADGASLVREGLAQEDEALVRTLTQRMRIVMNIPFFRDMLDPAKLARIARALRHQNED